MRKTEKWIGSSLLASVTCFLEGTLEQMSSYSQGEQLKSSNLRAPWTKIYKSLDPLFPMGPVFQKMDMKDEMETNLEGISELW